jgi:phosphatidylserine decarboxylase
MIDRAGWPFILGALVLAAALGWWLGPTWVAPGLLLAAFFVFFFRDPHRDVPTDPRLVVSPADGRVMIVGAPPGAGAPAGQWQQISIFLSPMDVHINRAPIGGRITRVEYHPGKFLPAYRVNAGELNEWTEVWFEHDGVVVVCRQIVGILARRIVTRLTVGQSVSLGERFGIMKFGSRIDLFLPLSATIAVKVGDTVVGGQTTLATLATIAPPAPATIGAQS